MALRNRAEEWLLTWRSQVTSMAPQDRPRMPTSLLLPAAPIAQAQALLASQQAGYSAARLPLQRRFMDASWTALTLPIPLSRAIA